MKLRPGRRRVSAKVTFPPQEISKLLLTATNFLRNILTTNFLPGTTNNTQITISRQVPALLDDDHVNLDNVHGHHHRLLLGLHTKVFAVFLVSTQKFMFMSTLHNVNPPQRFCDQQLHRINFSAADLQLTTSLESFLSDMSVRI